MTGRIEDVRDPAIFQSLVQAIFVAIRAEGFQVVDDASGDRGNDGYDPAQQALIAIYCPEGQPPRKRLLEKGRSDLAKAVRLRDGGQYEIVEWRFVTPQALPEEVQATLRQEAIDKGLTAVFISAQHLENWYLQYPHLRTLFPALSYPRNEAILEELQDEMRKGFAALTDPPGSTKSGEPDLVDAAGPAGADRPAFSVGLFAGFASDALNGIQSRLYGEMPGARYELEQFRLEAVNPIDRMAALMVETEYLQEQREYARVVPLSREGIVLARVAGAPAEGAVFKARLAYVEQMLLGASIMEISDRLGMMSLTGAVLVAQEEAEAHDRMVAGKRELIGTLFEESYREAIDSKNLSAQFTVLLLFAHAATQRTFVSRYRAAMGLEAGLAAIEAHAKRQIEKAYDFALLLARGMNSDVLVAMAYSNFANDLRSFGETERALAHAQRAARLSELNGDQLQREKTARLIGLLNDDLRGADASGGTGLGRT